MKNLNNICSQVMGTVAFYDADRNDPEENQEFSDEFNEIYEEAAETKESIWWKIPTGLFLSWTEAEYDPPKKKENQS
jgi:hypothetical protein